jgi:hypothetical protein
MKQFIVQVGVLATVMVGFNVFASEFDPKTGDLVAPEVLVVREDAQGNRVLLSVDKAPSELKSDADMQALAARAEKLGKPVDASEGGAEGSAPSEFDKASGTPAWYYWYYPTNNYGYGYGYNYWYSYGCYSYYPVSYYSWGYYRYSYYYRW